MIARYNVFVLHIGPPDTPQFPLADCFYQRAERAVGTKQIYK